MDINKCVELYRLMAKRCKDCGVAPNQAKIYDKMADFIATCNSAEESMNKIKNSEYYLAPSVALIQDKLGAWKAAAIQNNMNEIVEVVDEKLSKIEADNSEIYVTGYEQTIQRYKTDYILSMQAFALIFDAYIGYIATGEKYNLSDIDKQLQVLKYPCSDFCKLAKLPAFRNIIIVDDQGYKMFVNDICNYLNTGNLTSELFLDVNIDIEEQSAKSWKAIQAQKNDIIQAGKNPDNPSVYRHNLPEMKALAPNINMDDPSNIDGLKYSYVELGKFQETVRGDVSKTSLKSGRPKKQGLFSRLRGGK